MLSRGVIVDIIIPHPFERGINSRRETRLALHGAVSQWNDGHRSPTGGAAHAHGCVDRDLDREGGFESRKFGHPGGATRFSSFAGRSEMWRK